MIGGLRRQGASGSKFLDDPHLAMGRREVVDKVWLERRLDHRAEKIARFVGVHGLGGLLQAHRIPRIGIIDVADQPSPLETLDGRSVGEKDLFVCRLVTLPLSRAYPSPNDAHVHLDLQLTRPTRSIGRGAERVLGSRLRLGDIVELAAAHESLCDVCGLKDRPLGG